MVQCVSADVKFIELAGCAPSEFIAWVLEWSGEEAARSFRADWPSLSQIWGGLAKHIDRPPHAVKVGQFCEIVRELGGDAAWLTCDVWNQWVRRAKEKARDIVAKSVWQEVFAGLLPDAPPRDESSGG